MQASSKQRSGLPLKKGILWLLLYIMRAYLSQPLFLGAKHKVQTWQLCKFFKKNNTGCSNKPRGRERKNKISNNILLISLCLPFSKNECSVSDRNPIVPQHLLSRRFKAPLHPIRQDGDFIPTVRSAAARRRCFWLRGSFHFEKKQIPEFGRRLPRVYN